MDHGACKELAGDKVGGLLGGLKQLISQSLSELLTSNSSGKLEQVLSSLFKRFLFFFKDPRNQGKITSDSWETTN